MEDEHYEVDIIRDRELILAFAKSENNRFSRVFLNIQDKEFAMILISINPSMLCHVGYVLSLDIELVIEKYKHGMHGSESYGNFRLIISPRVKGNRIPNLSLSEMRRFQYNLHEEIRCSLANQRCYGAYDFLKKVTSFHAKKIILGKLHDLNLFFHIKQQYRQNRHILMAFFVKYDVAFKCCWLDERIIECIL